MNNNSNIDFTEYDRVQDILMYLTDKITLSFVVALSKKNLGGQRSFFHYETQYTSDSYGTQLRSIKRNMSYYFLISNKDIFGSGIVLRPQDVEILIMLIEQRVIPWFFGTQEQHAFHMVDNKLVLKEFTPVIYTQSDTKFIGFEPIVYHYENSDQFAEGVNLLFTQGESCPLTVDKFMGLFNVLKSDMYNIACQLCTYAKVPPYGVNVFKPVGLGSSPNQQRNDTGWSNQNNYKGFGANSFLENAKKKGD